MSGHTVISKYVADCCRPAKLHSLRRREVHVWRVSILEAEIGVEQFYGTLSADEKNRAKRFVRNRDRLVFVVTRGVLRCLLGNYLNTAPEWLSFKLNEFGKPELACPSDAQLQFNVSHSAECSLLAFSRGIVVGVDIECKTSLFGADLAAQLFSKSDYARFRSLPGECQSQAFFNAWTRKEAFIKGIGRGLSVPLKSFDVTFMPNEAAQLKSVRLDDCDPAHWSLFALEVGGDYAAALAVESATCEIRRFNWDGGQF